MASLLTHAALPLLAGRVVNLPAGVPARRLATAAVVCACAVDLDLLAAFTDLRGRDAFEHRGFFHSLCFAALLAGAATALAFRRHRFLPVFTLLFAAAASHPLLDLLTRGGPGVALLSPFYSGRLLAPLQLIPVCPLGVDEYFGRLGAIVLGNELMLIVLPVAIATELVRGRRDRALTAATSAWVLALAALWLRWPWLGAPVAERPIEGYGPQDSLALINREPLPDGVLLTRLDALRPWLGKKLTPARAPWSAGFFPAWYGAEAGRWQDSRARLVGRTIFGFDVLQPGEARAWLERDQGFGLAPTEKYDLANGDYDFKATRRSLTMSHNSRPRPRFWFGLCPGVAAASIEHDEPFRAVDVVSPDGHVVRFHPVDIKALLAVSYYWQQSAGILGEQCTEAAFDSARRCSMNPGGLLIGTLNYLGRARRSFMIDVHPTVQTQYYAVASAQVDLIEPLYRPAGERFAALADVDFTFELSSTILSEEAGNVPASDDRTRYERVGARPVVFKWQATIALDESGEIIGGRWRGQPPDGPDDAAFISGGPLLGDGGTALDLHPGLEWPFIRALAEASTSEEPGVPRLER